MRLPTVSAITRQLDKPALVPWAANAACDYIKDRLQGELSFARLNVIVAEARKNYRTISQDALNIGKEVHSAIEAYLKRAQTVEKMVDTPGLSPRAKIAFQAFLSWKKESEITDTRGVEIFIKTDRYSGKYDWTCMLKGKLYVIDFKVSGGVYPENRYQVAAYRAADSTIEGCGILRLDRETGKPFWHDTSDTYEYDKKVFNALVDLWYATNRPDIGLGI